MTRLVQVKTWRRPQAITWTNDGPVYWHIYASPGFNELMVFTEGPISLIIHYDDVIMATLASQITSLTVVYSIVYSGVDQRKLQSSASLAFVRGIHRWPVNSPHKGPVTRKMFPFDDVIMIMIQIPWTHCLAATFVGFYANFAHGSTGDLSFCTPNSVTIEWSAVEPWDAICTKCKYGLIVNDVIEKKLNGRHLADDIVRCMMKEKFCILIKIFTEVCS